MKSKVVLIVATTSIVSLLVIALYVVSREVPLNWAYLRSNNEALNANQASSTMSLAAETPNDEGNATSTPITSRGKTDSVAGLYSGPFNLQVTEPQAGVVRIVGIGQFGGYGNQHSSALDATMSVANNMATYSTKNSDGSSCTLEFSFTDSELNVLQLEECDVELAVFAKGRLNAQISYRKVSN